MQVFELAKLKGVNAKQLAKELGLKGHLSLVPDEMIPSDLNKAENKPVEAVKEQETVIILPEKSTAVVDTVTKQFKIDSIRGGGHKSPYWNERFDLGVK